MKIQHVIFILALSLCCAVITIAITRGDPGVAQRKHDEATGRVLSWAPGKTVWTYGIDASVRGHAEIKAAFENWNHELGNTVFVEYTEAPNTLPDIDIVPAGTDSEATTPDTAAYVRYFHAKWGDVVESASVNLTEIYDNATPSQQRRIVTHEIGHVLGLDDVTDERCFMVGRNPTRFCRAEVALALHLAGIE